MAGPLTAAITGRFDGAQAATDVVGLDQVLTLLEVAAFASAVFLEIGTDTERPPRSGENGHAHRGVGCGGVDRRRNVMVELLDLRIEPIGPVPPDLGDSLRRLVDRRRETAL
jgi:hypothetical protein